MPAASSARTKCWSVGEEGKSDGDFTKISASGLIAVVASQTSGNSRKAAMAVVTAAKTTLEDVRRRVSIASPAKQGVQIDSGRDRDGQEPHGADSRGASEVPIAKGRLVHLD